MPSATPATGWRLLPSQPELGPAALLDLVTFHNALYAVGNATTDAAPGVIWTSTDGETWRSATGALSLEGIQINAVAAGASGIVAVGARNDHAVAVVSPDGVSWAVRRMPNGTAWDLQSVAAGPTGFVAVGNPTGDQLHGAAWWSADGRSWSAITSVEGSKYPNWDAVGASATRFVAVGTAGSKRATWISDDGRRWHRQASRSDQPSAARSRVRYANGQFLIPSGSEVWMSPDGFTWTHQRIPGEGNDVFDVAAAPGGGLVAVGRSSEGDQPGAVATSDPTTGAWTQLPQDPVFDHALILAILVAPDGTRLVGVGNSETGESIFVADLSILVQP
jgi:hypothetical protein